MTLTRPIAVAIGSLVLAVACADTAPAPSGRMDGEPCTSTEDCVPGLACFNGLCRRLCNTDLECDQFTQHCDDGRCVPGSAIVCGDSRMQHGEGCDDGNEVGNDGCSATCTPETGWYCDGVPSTCETRCGDTSVAGAEICDDGNTTEGDGCGANCDLEWGWYCTGEPSTCSTQCGDGIVAGDEACDEGLPDVAGCTATCEVLGGWECSGSPSQCQCLGGTQDHDDDGACMPACAPAGPVDCGGHDLCDDTSGSAVCTCDAGYQDGDGDLVCLPACAPEGAVDCHQRGVCDDGSGTATCACGPLCRR